MGYVNGNIPNALPDLNAALNGNTWEQTKNLGESDDETMIALIYDQNNKKVTLFQTFDSTPNPASILDWTRSDVRAMYLTLVDLSTVSFE